MENNKAGAGRIAIKAMALGLLTFPIFVVFYAYYSSGAKEQLAEKTAPPQAPVAEVVQPQTASQELQAHDWEKEREDALERAERANREIDAAQDAVMDEYRKNAVHHYTTKGAGHLKVDAFILKNGKTIFCKTSITDAGKAIDCSE